MLERAIATEKLNQVMKNPDKAIDAAKGILDMFKKKPDAPQQ